MQKAKTSWTKFGGICGAFCLYAGVRYGMLRQELTDLTYYGVSYGAPSPQDTSVIAFWVTLNLFSIVFVIWSFVRRRHVVQSLAIIVFAFLGSFILPSILDRPIPFL